MEHKIKWLTNSAFEISYKDKIIITDPSVRFMTYQGLDVNSYSKPDLITISHLHWDHISELKRLYEMYQPEIISGAFGKRELVKYLNANQANVIPAYPGQCLDYGFCKIEVLFSVHRNVKKTLSEQVGGCKEVCSKIDDKIYDLQEIGSLEMTNYLITFDDGFRVLIWGGDFCSTQENMLKNLCPDVALMQYSESLKVKFLNMVKAVNPKVCIPYHHDFHLAKEQWLPGLEEFKKMCPVRFDILDNLQTVSY